MPSKSRSQRSMLTKAKVSILEENNLIQFVYFICYVAFTYYDPRLVDLARVLNRQLQINVQVKLGKEDVRFIRGGLMPQDDEAIKERKYWKQVWKAAAKEFKGYKRAVRRGLEKKKYKNLGDEANLYVQDKLAEEYSDGDSIHSNSENDSAGSGSAEDNSEDNSADGDSGDESD